MRFRYKEWAIPEMEQSPYVAIDIEPWQGRFPEFFETQAKPLYLELGCGKGRFLIDLATRHPEANFLGIDSEANALISAKRTLEEAALPNCRLARFDIVYIEKLFTENQVNGLYINFPNPWPKKRHHKRRLTHPRQLVHYRNFLRDGAEIWFKTDDQELYEASLAYFRNFGFTVIQHTPDLAHADDPSGIMTEYEEKWRGKNIPIKAIHARKTEIAPALLQERLELFLVQDP